MKTYQLVAWCHTTDRLCQDWLFLMGKMLKESRTQKPILSLASLQLPCQMAQKKCIAFTVASVIFTGCQCPSFFIPGSRVVQISKKHGFEKMSIAPFVAASWNPSHHELIRWVRKKQHRLNFNRKCSECQKTAKKKKKHIRKTSYHASWIVTEMDPVWHGYPGNATPIPPPEANSDPAIKGGMFCW